MNKIDWSKPVQTRDGRKVEIWKTDALNRRFPVVGVVYNEDATECYANSWTIDGLFLSGCGNAGDGHIGDLINVPEEVVGYLVVVYYKMEDRFDSVVFNSEYNAKKYISYIDLGVILVKYEEIRVTV